MLAVAVTLASYVTFAVCVLWSLGRTHFSRCPAPPIVSDLAGVSQEVHPLIPVICLGWMAAGARLGRLDHGYLLCFAAAGVLGVWLCDDGEDDRWRRRRERATRTVFRGPNRE